MTGMDKAQTIKDKMDQGEGEMSETLEAYMAIAVRLLVQSKKSARRACIRRQWEAEGQD